MRIIQFSIPTEYDGVTLRGFLRCFVRLSSRQTARLKRQPGGITRNGVPITAPELLRSGDTVALAFHDDTPLPEPAALPVSVLYEDEDLLVVDKPAAMPMYPCPGHDRDSLANAVSFLQAARQTRYAFRPVYRLDRDTTGAVVIAKNAFAASKLAGRVRKTYLAVCEGNVTGSGMIKQPIGLKPGHSVQRAVVPGGQNAVTRWRALSVCRGMSLVAVRLKTGRTHQIRVHFSAAGHPLAGDDMYGGNRRRILRQALHCAELRFRHPVTEKAVRIAAPLPEDMRALLI